MRYLIAFSFSFASLTHAAQVFDNWILSVNTYIVSFIHNDAQLLPSRILLFRVNSRLLLVEQTVLISTENEHTHIATQE